jgi:hypothetical protein
MAFGQVLAGVVNLGYQAPAVDGLLQKLGRYIAVLHFEETVLDLDEELAIQASEEGEVALDL